jgi:hypothetical protein
MAITGRHRLWASERTGECDASCDVAAPAFPHGRGSNVRGNVNVIARQQRLQSRAALHDGLIAKIAALHFRQVEAIDAHGDVPAVQQGSEIRLTMDVADDQLAAAGATNIE